jgi:glutathione S-transferase
MVAAASADKLIFYDSGSCPYAQRVWLALEEKGLEYETVRVDLANRTQEFTDLYRSVSLDDHLGKVPVLIDGDKKLIESSPIVEYLDHRFPSQGQRLLPEDPLLRYRVKLWVDAFNDKLAVFPILRATTKAQVEEGKQKLIEGLKYLESFLQKYAVAGEPGYFLGADYSFAETATTPFIRRYLRALPEYRSIDVEGIIQAEGLTRLQQWIKAALDRESNKKTGPPDEDLVKGFSKFVAKVEDA